MHGLTVRWSLTAAPHDVAKQLRDYVRDTSIGRFTGLPGLRFKTWRMVEGEWFEGLYVFTSAQARDEFAATFRAGMLTTPGTQIIGWPPMLVEPCEIVAVAEGPHGFLAGPGPGPA